MAYKLLSVSDVIIQGLYTQQICERFGDVDLIISCGDLPYYYLDYLISNLNVPLFFVRGNHANLIEYTERGPRRSPVVGKDLHRVTLQHNGLLLAGVEGSVRYNRGNFQYTQSEMWGHVLRLVPGMVTNRLLHGRYLDIFITHAPPWGINDQSDPAHQGIKAFRWLLKTFRPRYHIHGHIHLYKPDMIQESLFHNTLVINTFGYQVIKLAL